METLYHQTNALIQQTQSKFKELECNRVNSIDIEHSIQDDINTINKNCETLDILVMKVTVGQRPHAKMRCDQLKYDSKHLQAALAAAQQKRHRKELAATQREELLSTRFRANPESTLIDLDYAVQHHGAMDRAHRGVDEMLYTGANALESLRSQRNVLKGAHKRIMDMASTLGLSTHVMKLIERRAGQDKFILIGGIVLTLLIVVIVLMYFV
ncbi:PREDICTED: probable Golgi SNAP receptor complex member 2 [Nicrophorus vespilloides]|uniref:Probable Golgi SNAP receptor complex member 2 n=1 Tax=Nicrophorus vespilloides TaxID=110193 RepID=A0ABM1MDM8_NICVS|nr:PREDICTED: probable Golgi SNAP receptor complex member 2 [Nicrophorus vespilloides]